MGDANGSPGASSHYPLIVALTALGGVIIATLVAIFADEGNDPAARVARTSMGFLVAIVWIMAIADEVVQVLQARTFEQNLLSINPY